MRNLTYFCLMTTVRVLAVALVGTGLLTGNLGAAAVGAAVLVLTALADRQPV